MNENKYYNQRMTKNKMSIDEAETIIDDMYQDKYKIMSQRTNTGVTIDLSKMDEVTLTNLEFASVRALREVQSLRHKIEKENRENTDLKELYIRVAKYQEKKGHTDLAEYMLAQIQAIPTFTTWEEYTTWISKEDLRKILDKYAKKELDFAPELYKELRQLLEDK